MCYIRLLVLGSLTQMLFGCSPLINDITTDPIDLPVLKVVSNGELTEAKHEYPPEFWIKQEDAYPDIVSRTFAVNLCDAYRQAVSLLNEHENAQIISPLPEIENISQDCDIREVLVQAVFTTPLFRFRDDLVIRLRVHSSPSESDVPHVIVDIRSRSRVGKGDLGVNASRIRELLSDFEGGVDRRKGE